MPFHDHFELEDVARDMTSLGLDVALIGAASAGAHWLTDHKQLEPDWTWVEVGVGVAACLIHAHLQNALRPSDWRKAEAQIIRSFLLAGPPIVVGELAQWLRRRGERRRYSWLRQ